MLSRRGWAHLGLALGVAGTAHGQSGGIPDPLRGSRQLVLVVSPSWNASKARLQRFERRSSREAWRAVGQSRGVRLGRSGMAWGRGLHAASASGPRKREGDGRSVAGVYRLSAAYGYATPRRAKVRHFPYLRSHGSLRCVDDPRSKVYNRVVDERRVRRDWKSAEKMRRRDRQYRWLVQVDHNLPAALPGAGSCIFLHVVNRRFGSTAGCTAIEPWAMRRLVRWLDRAASPLLVQLPLPLLGALSFKWRLPIHGPLLQKR